MSVRKITPEATLIDGYAMMHNILHWPKGIKSDTGQQRLSHFRGSHNLSLLSPIPAKEIAVRVTDTKQ